MLLNFLIACVASAAIAILMGAYLRWLHRKYVMPLNYPNKELAGEIEQTRVVSTNCNPDKALLIARNALLSVPKCKILGTIGRRVDAKTGITFRTFGERITISATSDNADGTQLTIESKPRFPGTTVDYGKSYENVERIVGYLVQRHTAQLLSANNSFKPKPLRGSA